MLKLTIVFIFLSGASEEVPVARYATLEECQEVGETLGEINTELQGHRIVDVRYLCAEERS